MWKKILNNRILIPVFCSVLSVLLLLFLFFLPCRQTETIQPAASSLKLMDSYDCILSGVIDEAYSSALSVKKVFWIDEDADTVPTPNPENYGTANDPSTLQWLLDEAADLLDGQEMLFSTDVEIYPGSSVTYYYDETILAITWKQVFYDFVYTMCEVKIAHPSQFRRYIAENTYGSNYLYEPTVMASMVNAVAAESGDHYRGRSFGIVVYDGIVYQVTKGNYADTCYIDKNGDFHFTYRGEITDKETAQKFVDEHDISFSLAFGPILVDNGVRCEHASYVLGEVNEEYPRAAVCQKDKLH